MINLLSIGRLLLSKWKAVAAVAIALVALAASYWAGYTRRDGSADAEIAQAHAEIADLKRQYADLGARQALAALESAKKQEEANAEADRRYQERLARLRAEYERRLRERDQRAEDVRPGPVPAAPEPARKPDATAEELASCEADLAILEYDAAADALQLWELQEWLRGRVSR